MKKKAFLQDFARLFTRADGDAYQAILFQSSEAFGDETAPALTAPVAWSAEAVAVMAESAACPLLPAERVAIEENTVPSWLWRHRGRGGRLAAEGDLRDIFDRATGSAAAKAWQAGFFAGEKQARAFYDEARYALMQRHIVIAPQIIASWGLDWAYGIAQHGVDRPQARHTPPANDGAVGLSNIMMDALIGKATKNHAPAVWQKLFAAPKDQVSQITLRLSDIAADWHSGHAHPAGAVIDLMPLRQDSGAIAVDALRQTVRLLVVLLDLQDRPDVTIGVVNLAPLLMALGLAYDSDAGRAMAASITALITAEGYAASAEMAALRGASDMFADHREATMRVLRNHRRAVYGDNNDYEKLSVLPDPLPLKSCPDLALAAAAQQRWDAAVEAAQAFGLRATRITDLTPSPQFSLLTGAASQGLEPMPRLTLWQPDDADLYRVALHPAMREALNRLGYAAADAAAAETHVAGARSLRRAPGVDHAGLEARGLNAGAIEKIEAYLPCVDTLRLAVTPWIIGVDFCIRQLGLTPEEIERPGFDLLRHLKFTDADIAAADLYCYGHGSARSAKAVNLRHRALFACGAEISAEARIRMAAAAQSFISGDTGMTVALPAAESVARGAEITLQAWRRGLKSLALVFDPALAARAERPATTTRRIKATAQTHAAPATPKRRAANGKTVSAPAAKRDNDKRIRGH